MLLDDLGAYLVSQSLGVLGQTLFLGAMPLEHPTLAAIDEVLALLETPGAPALHVHSKAAPDVERPTVQVVVRGAPHGYVAARTRAQDAFVALASVHNQTLGGNFYLEVVALQSPWWLYTDEQQRPHIVFNVACMKGV